MKRSHSDIIHSDAEASLTPSPQPPTHRLPIASRCPELMAGSAAKSSQCDKVMWSRTGSGKESCISGSIYTDCAAMRKWPKNKNKWKKVGWYRCAQIADCGVCGHIQMVMRQWWRWEPRLTAGLSTDLPDVMLRNENCYLLCKYLHERRLCEYCDGNVPIWVPSLPRCLNQLVKLKHKRQSWVIHSSLTTVHWKRFKGTVCKI